MDRAQAKAMLKSAKPNERLRAARYITTNVKPDDYDLLREVARRETVSWVKLVLDKALESFIESSGPSMSEIVVTSAQDEVKDDLDAQMIEKSASLFVHELRPILGRIETYASQEVRQYEQSRTKTEISRLKRFLKALDRLKRAAGAARIREFDLAELIQEVVTSESTGHDVEIEVAGTAPLIVLGDPVLVETVICQGLRNAAEAVSAVETTGLSEGVVINWGKTDRDYWIAILDHGIGLSAVSKKLFEIGSTTKAGHLGMGLALAKAAVISMGGSIVLTPREDGGTRFEFRWPKNLGGEE